MTADWLAFWNTPQATFVNERHKDVHYRLIAEDIVGLVPSPQARVLDYGCGEALHADLVAAVADELLLCEAATRIRSGLATRFAYGGTAKQHSKNAKIHVLAPEELEKFAAHSIDLIVLHSVAQYLAKDETAALFALFHRLLKSNGALFVGDVIPPHTSALSDTFALLRQAASNGFLLAALAGLAKLTFSSYRRLRGRLGLTRYTETAMLEMLAAAGFVAQRAAKNIGHDPARLAFMARLR
jgi:SAM-dependent methyltransferase